MAETATPTVTVAAVAPNEKTRSACLGVAEGLSEYFTPDALSGMAEDLRKGRLFVADEAGAAVGFAVVRGVTEDRAEILWMAVRRDQWRRGIGAELVERVLEDLRSRDVELLSVKTPAEGAGYPPYEGTRRFYERMGFVHAGTLDPCPEWTGGDPCAAYTGEIHTTSRGA